MSERTLEDAFVYDAIRTPFGRFGGALSGVRPDDLAAHVVREIVQRAPGLTGDGAAEHLDEVIFGNANGAGEENRNVARMATLLAGLPTSIPGTTVNRLCGSSLDAAIIGSRQIATGEADVILVGGVESMTRAPWVLPKTEKPYPAGNLTLASTTLGWRLVNPAMPAEWTVSLGEATEQLREKYAITRERQDAFAERSHRLSVQAWDEGFYADLTVPVPGVDLARDESIRPDTTIDRLAGLRTSFRPEGGTVTAGNASPLNDGASAVLLGSATAAEAIGLEPVARIAGRGASALDPQYFGYAPVEAAEIALGLHRCVAHRSRDRQPAWWGARHRPPAGRLGRPDPRHPGSQPAAQWRAVGGRVHLHRCGSGPGRRPRERWIDTVRGRLRGGRGFGRSRRRAGVAHASGGSDDWTEPRVSLSEPRSRAHWPVHVCRGASDFSRSSSWLSNAASSACRACSVKRLAWTPSRRTSTSLVSCGTWSTSCCNESSIRVIVSGTMSGTTPTASLPIDPTTSATARARERNSSSALCSNPPCSSPLRGALSS